MTRHRSLAALALVCLVTALAQGSSAGRPADTQSLRQRCNWSIGIYAGTSPFRLGPVDVKNPVIAATDVKDVPARYVADPFMIEAKGNWYLFFEVMNARTRQGDIGLATSSDLVTWEYKQIVLDEPFHLSYPYVFRHLDQYYMIPESHDANSVRLYKAVSFPTKWQFVKTLLVGSYVDPCVFQHEGKWWMFVGGKKGRQRALRIYYASDPTGPWTEHPKSPYAAGNDHACRPGGRVVKWNDKLFRFAQDDDPSYGRQVWAFEITKLTTTEFEEAKVPGGPVVKGATRGWNAGRMHHIDPHEIRPDEWIACVDGCTTP